MLLYRRVRYGYSFRRIPLTRGKYAIVDPDDYGPLSRHKWLVQTRHRSSYAVRHIYIKNARKKCLAMHRLIINAPDGIFVDHINHNGLDNRKANLRLATCAQNGYNRQKTLKKTWSKYKGVSFHKRHKKWQAKIVINGRNQHLGSFNNELDAGRAYDRAARELYGEFAALNFES